MPRSVFLSVGRSVEWSICHNFLNRQVTLQCSFRRYHILHTIYVYGAKSNSKPSKLLFIKIGFVEVRKLKIYGHEQGIPEKMCFNSNSTAKGSSKLPTQYNCTVDSHSDWTTE